MKAPRPIIVAVVLLLVTFVHLTKPPVGTGAEAAGYFFGTLFFLPALALVYTWWYRRRRLFLPQRQNS